MNEPLESLAEEVTRLRRCLNDLARLVAPPDVRTSSEPAAIVSSVLDELTRSLRPAFVFVRSTDPEGGSSSEMRMSLNRWHQRRWHGRSARRSTGLGPGLTEMAGGRTGVHLGHHPVD